MISKLPDSLFEPFRILLFSKQNLIPEYTVEGDFDTVISDFKIPDSKRETLLNKMPKLFGGKLKRLIEPYPYIVPHNCIGCYECVRCCPRNTIDKLVKNGKPKAEINRENCIKCYCCQELCPKQAVIIKRNILFR